MGWGAEDQFKNTEMISGTKKKDTRSSGVKMQTLVLYIIFTRRPRRCLQNQSEAFSYSFSCKSSTLSHTQQPRRHHSFTHTTPSPPHNFQPPRHLLLLATNPPPSTHLSHQPATLSSLSLPLQHVRPPLPRQAAAVLSSFFTAPPLLFLPSKHHTTTSPQPALPPFSHHQPTVATSHSHHHQNRPHDHHPLHITSPPAFPPAFQAAACVTVYESL